jgi:hypothetical protein
MAALLERQMPVAEAEVLSSVQAATQPELDALDAQIAQHQQQAQDIDRGIMARPDCLALQMQPPAPPAPAARESAGWVQAAVVLSAAAVLTRSAFVQFT